LSDVACKRLKTDWYHSLKGVNPGGHVMLLCQSSQDECPSSFSDNYIRGEQNKKKTKNCITGLLCYHAFHPKCSVKLKHCYSATTTTTTNLDVSNELFGIGLFLLNACVEAHQLQQFGKTCLQLMGVTEKLRRKHSNRTVIVQSLVDNTRSSANCTDILCFI